MIAFIGTLIGVFLLLTRILSGVNVFSTWRILFVVFFCLVLF